MVGERSGDLIVVHRTPNVASDCLPKKPVFPFNLNVYTLCRIKMIGQEKTPGRSPECSRAVFQRKNLDRGRASRVIKNREMASHAKMKA